MSSGRTLLDDLDIRRLYPVEVHGGCGADLIYEPDNPVPRLFSSNEPFGIPPIIPDTRSRLEQILREQVAKFTIKATKSIPFEYDEPLDIMQLVRTEQSPSPFVLHHPRDLCSGKIKDLVEEVTEEENVSPVDINLETDLLTCAPGLRRGIDFSDKGATSFSTIEPFSVDFKELFGAIKRKTSESDVPSKSSFQGASGDSDLILPDISGAKELYPDVLPISQAQEFWKGEYAQVVDISKPVNNFDELVPDPAFKWPFELDTFQKRAIMHLERRESVFVAAHTSAGKTVVAEYAIALSRRHMTKAIYTSPIKALSNEKYRDFKETFGDVGIVTGDVQINREAQTLVMTTEILRNMLYNRASIISDLEWVIFDECHYINDPERGVVWEEVLIMLPKHVSLVLLSATVPNATDLANWIGRIKQRKIYVIFTMKRPVPLEHHLYMGSAPASKSITAQKKKEFGEVEDWSPIIKIVDQDGVFLPLNYKKALNARKSKFASQLFRNYGDDKSRYTNLVQYLSAEDKLPVIIFTLSRRRCDENAHSLATMDLTGSKKEKGEIHHFVKRCISRLSKADQKLPQITTMRTLLENGFGVHHSGILPILKEVVEMLFQRGLIKVLFATETFAMGVNMPARTVVFDSIRKHDGYQLRDLRPSEYIQMAGRAGRRGKDKTGTVLIMIKRDVPEASELTNMMLGRPTALISKFKITDSMILNLKAGVQQRVEDMMKDSFCENGKQSQMRTVLEKKECLEKRLLTVPYVSCETCAKDINECITLVEDYSIVRRKFWEHVLGLGFSAKFFSLGKVVVYQDDVDLSSHLGMILEPPTDKEHVLTVLSLRDSNDLPALEEGDYSGISVPWPINKRVWCPPKSGNFRTSTVKILPRQLVSVASKQIRLEMKRAITAQQRALAGEELLMLTQSQGDDGVSALKIIKELRLNDIESVECWQELTRIEGLLTTCACVACPKFVDHFCHAFGRSKLVREIERVEFELSDQGMSMMPEYQIHVAALERLGYLEPGGPLTLKGRVARSMSNYEIILTELLLSDIIPSLEPPEVAALLSCFVYQGREQDVILELPVPMQKPVEQFRRIAHHIGDVRQQCGFDESAKTFADAFNFSLCGVVYNWAKGMTFAEIMKDTEEQEGIIVRCIQRLDELLKDVRGAAKVIGNPDLHRKMEAASNLIRKDIVFAASLYLE